MSKNGVGDEGSMADRFVEIDTRAFLGRRRFSGAGARKNLGVSWNLVRRKVLSQGLSENLHASERPRFT